MGKVFTDVTIVNRADQILSDAGVIPVDRIRTVTLKSVLVDTGATPLCLPPETIETLGLQLLQEVNVSTAMGIGKSRVFQDASLVIQGRKGTFECLELPGGRDPLLGVIPLEALGLEPDLEHQRLRLLPIGPTDTYLTIL